MNKKHYTGKEIVEKFKKKPDHLKVKIYEKALQRAADGSGGSYVYCIAMAMGYGYSDLYDEPTYVK